MTACASRTSPMQTPMTGLTSVAAGECWSAFVYTTTGNIRSVSTLVTPCYPRYESAVCERRWTRVSDACAGHRQRGFVSYEDRHRRGDRQSGRDPKLAGPQCDGGREGFPSTRRGAPEQVAALRPGLAAQRGRYGSHGNRWADPVRTGQRSRHQPRSRPSPPPEPYPYP